MDVQIDTSSFAKFARDLRRADAELARKFNTALKEAGEIVAVQARANASWSSEIPQTIKVRRAAGVVRVTAGGQEKPHAGEAEAFEHNGEPGTFRHPVFGHKETWVSQRARPFLRPALEMHRGTALKLAERALNEAMRAAGFR